MKGQYGLQQAGTGDVTARPLVRAVLLDPFGVPAGDDHVSLDEKDIVQGDPSEWLQGWVDVVQFWQLVGRYCSYLLP